MKNFKLRIKNKNNQIKDQINLNNKLYLFGYNDITTHFLREKLSDTCVVDKNHICEVKKINKIKNIKIEIIETLPPNSVIVNCITGINAGKIRTKLNNLGHTIFSWIEIKNALNIKNFQYWYLVNFDDFFFKNSTRFLDVYKKLTDFRSKKEFIKILSYKVAGNEKSLIFNKENIHNQYFPEFLKLDEKKILIDVGAYDGDTIKNFLSRNQKFKKIVAFEPDEFNFKILQENFKNNNKVSIHNFALGSNNKLVNFHSSQDKSKIDKNGDHRIFVRTLDSLKLIPDFIKVDIEGSEEDFILGSKKTILRYKPQIAICVYHKSNDFYNLVDLILSINNKYKLYFRHHSFGFTESVMYFI